MFDDFFQAATNVDHQAHEAPSSNLQLFLKVLMMTIIILKLHMNNDPSSGVPLSKPDFKDSPVMDCCSFQSALHRSTTWF